MTLVRTIYGRRSAVIRAALATAVIGIAMPAMAAEPKPASHPAPSPAARPTQPQPAAAASPRPHPLPGHRKHAVVVRRAVPPSAPKAGVANANAAARVEPARATWLNAIQQYAYADGALYQVYSAPGRVTDVALEEGEELVGPGPVAAGDTTRWVIGDTVSGSAGAKRVHILVKPTRPDLVTNLVINTDRRTYHLELRATPAIYMAAVSWTYPQDQLIAVRAASAEAARAAPIASGIDPAALNFRYRIEGDTPAWRPTRAFDDGRRSYVEFPAGIETADMPPLFVLGDDGAAELVNYRVQGRYMIVDRLFGSAELRLGARKGEQRVQIAREDSHAKRRGRS